MFRIYANREPFQADAGWSAEEKDFGTWWRDSDGGHWRLSWRVDGGELYLERLGPGTTDRLPRELGGTGGSTPGMTQPVVLIATNATAEQVEEITRGWWEFIDAPGSLALLISRVAQLEGRPGRPLIKLDVSVDDGHRPLRFVSEVDHILAVLPAGKKGDEAQFMALFSGTHPQRVQMIATLLWELDRSGEWSALTEALASFVEDRSAGHGPDVVSMHDRTYATRRADDDDR